MISYRNRIISPCLSLAIAGGLLSLPTVAAAAPVGELRQTTIAVSNLDLATPAGQATFEHRIAAAANRVCGQSTRDGDATEVTCRRSVSAQAHRAVGTAHIASN